jgi:D-alanyl-D-alanine endopeptidase (penicillin-binding protein 7)
METTQQRTGVVMRKIFVALLTCVCMCAQANTTIWVYNKNRNEVLESTNADAHRPIASITKLMTAMVVLESGVAMSDKMPLTKRLGGSLPRQMYSRQDLMNAMLVRSDNAAAETLAENYSGGRSKFIAAMNTRARLLGMKETEFDDASGLSAKNVSTARDVSIMLLAAAQYDFVQKSSIKKQVMLDAHQGKKNRAIALANTNHALLSEMDNVVVSKTGFTNPAGWCIGMVVEHDLERVVIVVLGSLNKDQRSRTVKQILVDHLPVRDWHLVEYSIENR